MMHYTVINKSGSYKQESRKSTQKRLLISESFCQDFHQASVSITDKMSETTYKPIFIKVA
ncbi:hypothetical protein BegalDRAFT_2519 [Beggiatoa alba B18LD]|uniref:Uncharacterized protein n=1 Tax=Beggiatoa alba B18LD TaxID=395493 RepID=I3CIB9_9GAMM|nr:hypothetical protein BegalDRAFT_2519 [Beggiatoa alba B18LD]